QAELVGNVAQPAQVSLGRGPYAAFALDRFDHDRGGLLADRGAHLVQIAEGDMIEAVHWWAETLEVGLIARGGQSRKGAAVERAMTTDHAVALGMAVLGLVFAGDLDRQLARFGAG